MSVVKREIEVTQIESVAFYRCDADGCEVEARISAFSLTTAGWITVSAQSFDVAFCSGPCLKSWANNPVITVAEDAA